jgi:hypothetical protein
MRRVHNIIMYYISSSCNTIWNHSNPSRHQKRKSWALTFKNIYALKDSLLYRYFFFPYTRKIHIHSCCSQLKLIHVSPAHNCSSLHCQSRSLSQPFFRGFIHCFMWIQTSVCHKAIWMVVTCYRPTLSVLTKSKA